MLIYPKGVFCLEAEWFGLRSTMTVRPALDLMRASDYHVRYIHRDVATRAELEHYLRKWMQHAHRAYPVLWLSIHAGRGILLPGDVRRTDEKLTVDELEELLAGKCRGRIIHFGGCRTIALPRARIEQFMRVTGAAAVSGFEKKVDWTESTLFEIAFLIELQKRSLQRAGLRAVARSMRAQHPRQWRTFGFKLFIRAK